MRKTLSFIAVLMSMGLNVFSQNLSNSADDNASESPLSPDIGIILSSNDAETVWNAFRFANFSLSKGETVTIFLIGEGVEALTIKNEDFDIEQKIADFAENGGQILACGTCLTLRHADGGEIVTVATLNDLYTIVKSSGVLLTF